MTSGTPLRVLIAEDETLIRLDLRGLLEQHGFFVCGEARDGLEAVELAREAEPDVAILDVKMPRLDGIEAARRITAERPLPIVMLTAYSDRGLVERAVAAGVFTYLVKPFRETDIVPAVRAAATRHAELLGARRVVGGSARSFAIDVPSESGDAWPLQVTYLPDGTVDISVRAVAQSSFRNDHARASFRKELQ
jgi:DNA-binding NarL/FixJ family response regulator